MFDVFHSLSETERNRIDKIEPFDEFEDMFLKFNHYLILCAANGKCSSIPRSVIPSSHTKTEVLPLSLMDADLLPLTKSSSIIQRFFIIFLFQIVFVYIHMTDIYIYIILIIVENVIQPQSHLQ